VEESSSTTSYVVAPLAFVAGSIRPYLDTVSMTLAVLDLTFINGSIGEHNLILEFEARFVGELVYRRL